MPRKISVTKEQFDYIYEVVCRAEDSVRVENPRFVSGFHAIMMQGQRIEHTVERLLALKENLMESVQIIVGNINGLRMANPDQTPKGTEHTKRLLRHKPVWEKMMHVYRSDANKENIDPAFYDLINSEAVQENEIYPAPGGIGEKEVRVEFERHDLTLRHKLKGIKKISDLVTHYISVLRSRLEKIEALEIIGNKWAIQVLEVDDIVKIEKAQREITEGSIEVKEIINVLNALPGDFTQFCGLEDVTYGMKRKMEGNLDKETEEIKKRKISSNHITGNSNNAINMHVANSST